MVNKTKILSDLSKMAVDAVGTFSGIKKEVNTIVRLRIDKTLNKMNLVRRDEFEVLKKIVQKLVIEQNKLKKTNKKPPKPKVQSQNSAKNIKKQQKNKPTALELQTLELQTLELQTSELQTLEVR